MAKTVALLVIALVLVMESEAWFFSRSSRSGPSNARPAHDVRSGSGLTRLYNQRVTHVDRVVRPLGNNRRIYGPISHSGVVVTTNTGRKWLVHKGDGYGVSGQTVVTDARHMSPRWRAAGVGRDVHNSRVADFVGAGGANYDLLRDNCHHGSSRMAEQPQK